MTNAEDTKKKKISEEELNELKELASTVAKSSTDFIKKYPVQSLIGAALLGYLLGSMRSKK